MIDNLMISLIFVQNSHKMYQRFVRTTKEKIVTLYLQSVLKDYGEIKTIKINSKNRTIYFEFTLKDQLDTINAVVFGYDVRKQGSDAIFEYTDIVTSREWLNIIIERHAHILVSDKTIKINNSLVKHVMPVILK